MPNPNAVVSRVIRFDPPLDRAAAEMLQTERGLSVELEGARRVRLDPDDPRSVGFAQVLDGLSKQHLRVYVEIDPATSTIKRLLIPHVTRVIGIRHIDEGVLGIELERSQARHVLRRDTPDFDSLERQLREALRSGAPIVLTENDRHEIIDLRGYARFPDEPPLPFPKPGPRLRIPWPWRWIFWPWVWIKPIWHLRWWPWWWFCCVSTTKAQQVFDAMNATSCNPITVPSPCIPFLYPDDGCWARAHEMCRLMITMGLCPKKVWIRGRLYVNTRNNPYCHVWWGWHVAPTLCVRVPDFLLIQTMVIDPSLFAQPVSKPTWKGVQGDPNATLTDTDASVFHLFGGPSTDPSYTQTNQDLAFYRLQLQARAVQQGSPPYANCP